jgi:CRP-like cAMP-binding protein
LATILRVLERAEQLQASLKPSRQAGKTSRPCISQAEKRSVLRQSPLFRALAPAELDRLAKHLLQRRFVDGQLIFSRGEPGSSVMAVVEGRVRIGIRSSEGREVLLGIVGPGEVFGELALLDGKGRSADATALGDCVLLSIDGRDLLPLLHRSPEAVIGLSEMVCGRLRAANEQLEGTVLMAVGARLARLLLTLEQGEAGAAMRVDTALSQADLGRRIGASRQKVNLHLRRWIAEGILAREGRSLLIRNRVRLLDIADVEQSQASGRTLLVG